MKAFLNLILSLRMAFESKALTSWPVVAQVGEALFWSRSWFCFAANKFMLPQPGNNLSLKIVFRDLGGALFWSRSWFCFVANLTFAFLFARCSATSGKFDEKCRWNIREAEKIMSRQKRCHWVIRESVRSDFKGCHVIEISSELVSHQRIFAIGCHGMGPWGRVIQNILTQFSSLNYFLVVAT